MAPRAPTPTPEARRAGAALSPSGGRRRSDKGGTAGANTSSTPPTYSRQRRRRQQQRRPHRILFAAAAALAALAALAAAPRPCSAAAGAPAPPPPGRLEQEDDAVDTGDAFDFAADEDGAVAAGGRWQETLAWSPRAFLMHRFLSDAEADHLVALAQPHMRVSQIVDAKTGKLFASDARTSKGHFLRRAQDAVVSRVERRIAAWSKLPPDHGETLHILEYSKTEQYRPHFDTFTDAVNVKRGGQRVATVLVYLSDVQRGGETIFPDAEPASLEPAAAARLDAATDAGKLSACAADAPLAVRPRKGDALLFYSVTPGGEPDGASLHASCPVEEGVKWSATRWIREGPFV
jgi:prolyl 4-hydroxylase